MRQGEARLRLSEVPLGEAVELECLDLPDADMEALLERGVLPGCMLCPVRRSPFGDPIIEVDGTVLALRRETAACLCVRRRTLGTTSAGSTARLRVEAGGDAA